MSGDLSLTSVFSFHNLAYGNCNYIFIYKVALARRQVGTFRSPSQVDICPLVYHILWKLHSFSFYCWSSSRKAVNTNFYRFWCDPTGNRTRLYSFNSWVADALSPLNHWYGGQVASLSVMKKILNFDLTFKLVNTLLNGRCIEITTPLSLLFLLQDCDVPG